MATMVLEQNAMPGLTNRYLARVVDAAALTYRRGRTVVRGQGIRHRQPGASWFLRRIPDLDPHPDDRRLLVFGGSQGAHAINLAMVEAAPRLANAGIAVTHQTGATDLEFVRNGYRAAGLDARVEAFLDDMDREMAAADLIVCRAGATTLAEITAAGRPAILVPLPTATDDHQRKNAAALASIGAADVLDQRDLTGETLAARVSMLASGRRPPARHGAARSRRGEAGRRGHDCSTRADAGAAPSGRQPRAGLVTTSDSTNVLGRTRRIHFVGIGGIGMSGIAELVANLGFAVSGSDAKPSVTTARLAGLGVRIFEGHDAANVGDADVVVVSSAVPAGNPEVVEARRRQVPVIPRAEMLAELMRLRLGIAIAGAHGKTTTTSMIAFALEQAGLDPTAVIGGRLSAFGSNARLGRGAYMVAEADESDGSFLLLAPSIAVITNVDREHLDHYGDFDRLTDAFVAFANKIPFYGAVIACADDPALAALLPRMTRRVVTYGLDRDDTDLTATEIALEPFGTKSAVWARTRGGRERLGELRLSVPGTHNLRNALAAIAVGRELDVDFARLAAALQSFAGAERRFERIGERRGVLVVDDYGHHPTEMAAVIAAARAGLDRRLVVVFQPHRFTRTAQLLDEFARVLGSADVVVLTDIYAAGEPPIEGITAERLAERIGEVSRAPVHVVRPLEAIGPAVAALARDGDLVVTLGAGSIGTVGAQILASLERGRAAGEARR